MTEYKKWIDAAARLAQKLHAGQSDKSGVDYSQDISLPWLVKVVHG